MTAEIANINLNSALKDSVYSMIHGTGLKCKETGHIVELFNHYGEPWGTVQENGTDEQGNQLYKYDSAVSNGMTGDYDMITNAIHDDMANSWEFHEVPNGAFRDAMESVSPAMRKALIEAYVLCHKKLKTPTRVESVSSASKQKWIRKMYAAAKPLLKGLKRDDAWQNVWQLFATIEKAVPEVTFNVGAQDGGYHTNSDGMKYKVYDIVGQTPEGFPINGQLVCAFAGPSDNPESCYDMSLILN